jgi:hypothetical protein
VDDLYRHRRGASRLREHNADRCARARRHSSATERGPDARRVGRGGAQAELGLARPRVDLRAEPHRPRGAPLLSADPARYGGSPSPVCPGS